MEEIIVPSTPSLLRVAEHTPLLLYFSASLLSGYHHVTKLGPMKYEQRWCEQLLHHILENNAARPRCSLPPGLWDSAPPRLWSHQEEIPGRKVENQKKGSLVPRVTLQSGATQQACTSRWWHERETSLCLIEAIVFWASFCYSKLGFTLIYVADTDVCLL